MKTAYLLMLFLLLPFSLFADYVVAGGDGIPLKAKEDAPVIVYLLNGLSGASISYTSSEAGVHQWYKYTERANEAIPVLSEQNGNTSVIDGLEDGCGYFVGATESPRTQYIWIIDYSRYLPVFHSLSVLEEGDRCSSLTIVPVMDAEELFYRMPTGTRRTLNRTYLLKYKDMVWEEESRMFFDEEKEVRKSGIFSELVIDAPLADTDFTLFPDDFSEHFGLGQPLKSPFYEAIAVEAHAFWERDRDFGDNELTGEDSNLSAPVRYTYTAYANEPVASSYLWKVIKYDNRTGIPETLIRYTEKELRYTFEEWGRYVVKLEVIGSKAVCVDTTQVFDVVIGQTTIEIPNVFSPGSSIGINDEFKIAFTSLLSFRATIYSRWGGKLFEWTDPTKGWDGRVNGKFVPTGVYYVIVEYTDSDFKKRTKSSDINILRSKNIE